MSIRTIVEGTWNNVFITVLDKEDKLIVKGSIGITGNKGTKWKSEFGAYQLGKSMGDKLMGLGYWVTSLFVRGCWKKGENSTINGLESSGLLVDEINIIYRVPHNGVRKKKVKRR